MDIFFPRVIFFIPLVGTLMVLSFPKGRASFTPHALRNMVIISIGGSAMGLWAIKTLYDERNMSFNGVIQKVCYEKPKEIPYVTIKRIEYCWGGSSYPNNDTIKAGDSAVKVKGSFEFKLIRRK
ncbi:hypothetical protein [Mucilaginibacter sp.]|uniref:hypothetical protein n=1 Tax=Mucilaginibacter sp. TaxID=1882438 RepID=UPI0025F7F3B5|nr:hypothetical protein [Mucilaginibacter sp.]